MGNPVWRSLSDLSPQTILYTHSSDELYGSDVVLLELARRLDPVRYRPVVVTPTDIAYEGRLSGALKQNGIAHYAQDMPVLRRRYLSATGLPLFLRRLVSGPRRLRKLFDAEHVKLVHSNTSAVWGGALAASNANLPHIWHIHEIVQQPKLVRKLLSAMIARYSRRANTHVVAISRAVADHLLADQPALSSRLSVIYDAVDHHRFHPDNNGRSLRQTWNVNDGEVLVGVVGRISAWKGQKFFLQALAQARNQAPNLRSVIVGDAVPGELQFKQSLMALVTDLGLADQVIWAGFRDDAPQVMAALDILVLPSVQPEPFGMVVLEAMATARPVVATAHGGPLETVLDGETGFLTSASDPDPLADALVRLASRPELRLSMGARGRARVLDSFGFTTHMAAFQDLYACLLAARI